MQSVMRLFGGNPVLDVWLRSDFDEDLPAVSCADVATGKVGAKKGGNRSSKHVASAIRIAESISVSGTWTLCRLEGLVNHPAQGFAEKLRAVVDALVVPYSDDDCRFFPAFQESDPLEQIQTTMPTLRRDHPELLAATWYIENSQSGLFAAKR